MDVSITSYTVVRDGSATVTYSPSSCTGTGAGTVCSLVFDSLAIGYHDFAVVAVNSVGSGESSVASADIPDPDPVEVVVSGRVRRLRAQQAADSQNVTVRWRVPLLDGEADASLTSYAVVRDDVWSSSFLVSGCTGPGRSISCSVTYTSLSLGRHTFSVAAVNPAGTGRASTVRRRVRSRD